MSRPRLVVVRLATAGLALAVVGGSPVPARATGVSTRGEASPPAAEAAPKAETPAGSSADEADPNAERARELAQQGRTAYWNGEYRQAIEHFDAAYALVPDPNLLYNISAAYEKLEQFDRALEYLDRYEPDAPEDERDAIAARRRELERAKAEAAPDSAPKREPTPVDPPPGQDPMQREPEPTPQPRVMGGLGWTFVAIAGAGLGVGAGFGIAALTQSRNAGDACFDDAGSLRCPSSAQAPIEAARRNAIIADVGFGVAVLATAATLTLVGVRLRARKQAKARGKTDVAWQGLGATVRF